MLCEEDSYARNRPHNAYIYIVIDNRNMIDIIQLAFHIDIEGSTQSIVHNKEYTV